MKQTLKEQLENAWNQVQQTNDPSPKYLVGDIKAGLKAVIELIQEGIDQKQLAKVEGTMNKLIEISNKLDQLEKKIGLD
jgi:N-methylhydantoinase B/oxoprolinase/acetone carboxylase alpha subunit